MEKKRLVIGIIGVAAVLVVLGTTVAYFLVHTVDDNKEVLTVNTGSLSLTFEDGNDGIQVKSLMLGESVSKELKITNNGTLPVTTNLNWKDLTNTFHSKSLSYKLEYKTTESGAWENVDNIVGNNVPKSLSETETTLAKDITIPNGKTYYYKITITLENLENIIQETDRSAMLATRFSLGDFIEAPEVGWVPEAVIAVLSNQTPEGVNEGNPAFGNAATTDEGIYAMEDDYGTSYYYRGAVENNYVKFGGFYWRIIRINGDGSLRMIYDGQQAYDNGTANDLRNAVSGIRWTVNDYDLYDDAKYVGYMYGPANSSTSSTTPSTSRVQAQTNVADSNAKAQVDTWYRTNMLTNAANGNKDLTPYLADSIFCNDRSISPTARLWWSTENNSTTNRGFSKYITAYGGFSRYYTPKGGANETPNPTFVCPENTTVSTINDKFTVETSSGGNGKLTYPVGLITADEIVAAGSGKLNTQNSRYYLYKSSNYFSWSLSPGYMRYNGSAYMFIVDTKGALLDVYIGAASGAVAPVINLKAEYAQQLVGTGVQNDEYRLKGVQ